MLHGRWSSSWRGRTRSGGSCSQQRPKNQLWSEHRPSTRFEEHARVGFGDKKHSRGPSESQKEEINALKKELVDTQFLDESIRWKIIDIKWNGKYKKIMVHYYDMDQFDNVPSSPKNQEYTPIVVIRKILQENNL